MTHVTKPFNTGNHPCRVHGGTGTTEYKAWEHMRARCNNETHPAYADYGGRGIKVCQQWDYAGGGFATFLQDMGFKPSPEYTLDRIDNDLGYEPGNCRWATRAEQNRNRRGLTTPEQDQAIRDGIALGLNFRQIGEIIGKSSGAASCRAYRLGLKSGQPPGTNMTMAPNAALRTAVFHAISTLGEQEARAIVDQCFEARSRQ